MAHYLGLDLGGTNVKAGVIDATGKLLAKVSEPTNGAAGSERVIETMLQAGKQACEQANLTINDIAGIGIGSPGPINFEQGVIVNAPNLPGFENLPLRQRIADATGRPCVLENDANAAAFGEYWAGAGRDKSIRHLLMMTLGTGVGTGMIHDGRLIHGGHDSGAEGGHIIVEPNGRLCGCGQRGCIEAYASASHTANRAREELANSDEPSALRSIYEANPDNITAKAIFEAAEAGDAMALRIIDKTADMLGIACVNFCRVLDPQMIVFAGGMALAGEFLLTRVRVAFEKHRWNIAPDNVQLVVAGLGNDAGVIGAAAVAADADQSGQLG